MSFSQAFLDAGRKQVRDFVVLVRVQPRDPVTLAPVDVYLASDSIDTPAGSTEAAHVWLPLLLDHGSVLAPGDLGNTDLGLASTTITLARNALDTTLLIDNARVDVWLWDRSLATATFDDAGPVLIGGAVLSWDCDAAQIVLTVRQRTDWNRDLVPVEVTPEAYPQAPEDSIGQRVPIVYGRLSDVPWRSPFPQFPTVEDLTDAVTRGLSLVLGGRRAGAAVLVDTGRGAGDVNNPKAKVLVASHKCRKVADPLNGCGVYLKTGDRLSALDAVTPASDVVNTDTEAGLLIPDNAPMGWITALPVDVDVVANSAQNPRAVLDPFNDANYAKLDWTNNLKTLRMKFGALDDPGDMYEVKAVVCYRSPANTNLKCRIRNVQTGVTVDVALAPSATVRTVMFFVANVWAAAPLNAAAAWAFTDVEIEVGWPTSTPVITGTGTAEVYFAGFAVRYRPRQDTLESEKVITRTETRPIGPRGSGGKALFWAPYTVRETVPAVQELRGKFFANVEGWADEDGTILNEQLALWGCVTTLGGFTASYTIASPYSRELLTQVEVGDVVVASPPGYTQSFPIGTTVTGFANGGLDLVLSNPAGGSSFGPYGHVQLQKLNRAIERPPDVLAHLLQHYGGEDPARIALAAGEFGSLIDARAALLTLHQQAMRLAFSVGDTTDVMTAISWVAQGAASLVVLDRFTDRWRMIPWRADAPTDYAWKVRPEDIVEPALQNTSRTPVSRVLSGLSLGYGYDAVTRQFLSKVRLAWNGSNGGQLYRGLRDQGLVVDSSNDRLDFWTNATWAATLTHGTFSAPDFAQMLSAAMYAGASGNDFCVAWGFQIVEGYNDQLYYRDATAAVDRTITLTPGLYTMEGGAAMIQAAIDAANGSSPTDFIFMRSQRKFMVRRYTGSLWLYPGTGPLRSQRLYATLGWDSPGTVVLGSGTYATAPRQRDDQTLVIAALTYPIDIFWENGVHGLNGTRTNCASLCGFIGLRDTSPMASGTARSWLADGPKGDRENALYQTAQRFGAKRDTVEDLRAVADTDTALEVRNRIATLMGKPRVQVQFSTHAMPDIERGRVFEFSSDFDGLVTYPDPDSDGLWTGKRFVAVETEQFLGPAAFYTKVRAVALD